MFSAASTFPYFALGTFALQDRLALGLRALDLRPRGALGGHMREKPQRGSRKQGQPKSECQSFTRL
jgi:hypothetical protein